MKHLPLPCFLKLPQSLLPFLGVWECVVEALAAQHLPDISWSGVPSAIRSLVVQTLVINMRDRHGHTPTYPRTFQPPRGM
eukprot:290599-Amphidinium_carterae.1